VKWIFQNEQRRIETLAAALGAVLVTVLMTWPLAPRAWDHVLRALYHWDAYTNAMIMGCRVDAILGRGPLSLYDNYFFAPLARTIVFNENHFGLSLVFFPFYVLTNNPLFAYNVTLLLSMAGSVFCTYLLVRRLTNNGYAGFLVGVGFAFCPYVTYELGRIQLVATQWIPAAFLFLHRALEQRRIRDIAAFWCVYLLQIGTCLYYAMFLIPLLGLVAAGLLLRHRGDRRFYVALLAAPLFAGGGALLMVYPYFAERHAFDLERSLAFASSYDGKLSFFANVHGTNQTLTWMHHAPVIRGALEEIAFPGFTVTGLALLAVGCLVWALFPRGKTVVSLVYVAVVGALAIGATLVVHSMLAGIAVLALALVWHARRRGWAKWSYNELYLLVLLIAALMFLGNTPWHWQGEPVRGLYYYFHTYFPGFNGIRKVSRQAVMVTFVLAVLGGFCAAWLSSKLRRGAHRGLVFCALLAFLCFELRTFPHPLQPVWAGQSVPKAYAFMRTLPKEDIVAVMPQTEGVQTFVWDDGMAYHNYLALYHKHRFANGQSSWAPQVTDLVLRTLTQLPHDDAHRVLWMVGVRHVLIHAQDLPPARRNLPELLLARPGRFQRVFHDRSDHVFSLLPPGDSSLELLAVPPLPPQARRVASNVLQPESNLEQGRLRLAVDDNVDTYWSTLRWQRAGHFFGLRLDRPRNIVALEIHNPWHEMFLPASYTLHVQDAQGAWRSVLHQPKLRLYRQQIHEPKSFVFRLVLDQPVWAEHIRLTVDEPLPGYDIVVHEARVYEQP
jgi:hypothetical protein